MHVSKKGTHKVKQPTLLYVHQFDRKSKLHGYGCKGKMCRLKEVDLMLSVEENST